MTISGGRNRRNKPDPKYPWLIPAITVFAVVVVVVGIIVTLSLGIKLF
jgi:hypothetical protein